MTTPTFTTDYNNILQQVDNINPSKYEKTRNYITGAVTKLSPYISRGVISTHQILEALVAKGYKLYEMEKLVQELAWRDYYQQVWITKQDAINSDLRQEQPGVKNYDIPTAVVEATTGISAIDDAITEYYKTGYLHNHIRMYIASIVCNIGRSHWLTPARWMYYHLLDADWASNALSWQWTAAAFSTKKYYANQDNVNKFCNTYDDNTFLSVSYDDFEKLGIPPLLRPTQAFNEVTTLPIPTAITINPNEPTFVYNFYNLSPTWCTVPTANKVLLLEPSFFKTYPVSDNTITFILKLANTIPNMQVFVGEFAALKTSCGTSGIYYKEHPTNRHYKGLVTPRECLVPSVTGYYPSFFGYWKNVEKQLKKIYA